MATRDASAWAAHERAQNPSAPVSRAAMRKAKRQAVERGKANGAAKAARLDRPEWETLRTRVRERLAETGADFGALAPEIGRTRNTVRISLLKRAPPPPSLSHLFTAWLTRVEVVPAASGFGGEGRSQARAAAPLARDAPREGTRPCRHVLAGGSVPRTPEPTSTTSTLRPLARLCCWHVGDGCREPAIAGGP